MQIKGYNSTSKRQTFEAILITPAEGKHLGRRIKKTATDKVFNPSKSRFNPFINRSEETEKLLKLTANNIKPVFEMIDILKTSFVTFTNKHKPYIAILSEKGSKTEENAIEELNKTLNKKGKIYKITSESNDKIKELNEKDKIFLTKHKKFLKNNPQKNTKAISINLIQDLDTILSESLKRIVDKLGKDL